MAAGDALDLSTITAPSGGTLGAIREGLTLVANVVEVTLPSWWRKVSIYVLTNPGTLSLDGYTHGAAPPATKNGPLPAGQWIEILDRDRSWPRSGAGLTKFGVGGSVGNTTFYVMVE